MVIHPLTKLTPIQRKAAAKDYFELGIRKKDLRIKYGISAPTLDKLLTRARYGDFTIHSSMNKRYQTIEYGLRRLSKVQKKIEDRLRKQAVRYEKNYPGELIHFDTKQLPLMVGETRKQPYEYLFVAIDDYSRELYAAIYPDKSTHSAAEFLVSVIRQCPYTIERILTDNGSEYNGKSGPDHAFSFVATQHGIQQSFTRPYRPQTNGKAERVIRTLMEGWHHHELKSRQERKLKLNRFINYYNTAKPHKGIDNNTPLERLYQYFYPLEKVK